MYLCMLNARLHVTVACIIVKDLPTCNCRMYNCQGLMPTLYIPGTRWHLTINYKLSYCISTQIKLLYLFVFHSLHLKTCLWHQSILSYINNTHANWNTRMLKVIQTQFCFCSLRCMQVLALTSHLNTLLQPHI